MKEGMSADATLGPLAGVILRAQPDSRLVRLFREGHEHAYDELVRRYRPALVAFAGGIVPGHRAEDIVQESLLRAHGALRGENDIDFRPWLYTIVRNRAFNDLRDQRVHEHLDEDYDGVPQPPDVLARREDLAGLVAKLKALPDAQREAIVKRELEGRSHEEIALALGATPGAVRGLIFRARVGLRSVGGFLLPSSLIDLALGSPGTTGAAGVAAGGGAGLLMKAGIAATIGALAVGSGVTLDKNSGSAAPAEAAAAVAKHTDRRAPSRAPVGDTASSARTAPAIAKASPSQSPSSGPGGAGQPADRTSHSPSSGPGPNGDAGSGTSGSSEGSPAAGDGFGSGHSGSGSSGEGGRSSGSGSGSGSSDDGGAGSGSGPGSSGSDSSGSGLSGSDGGGSGESGGGDGITSGSGSGSDGSGSGSSGSSDVTTSVATAVPAPTAGAWVARRP